MQVKKTFNVRSKYRFFFGKNDIRPTYQNSKYFKHNQEWQFTKDNECAGVYFQIWRPDPNINGAFQLIGWNRYDGTAEACSSTADNQLVRVRIPKDKQIPVEPNDVIGWYVFK